MFLFFRQRKASAHVECQKWGGVIELCKTLSSHGNDLAVAENGRQGPRTQFLVRGFTVQVWPLSLPIYYRYSEFGSFVAAGSLSKGCCPPSSRKGKILVTPHSPARHLGTRPKRSSGANPLFQKQWVQSVTIPACVACFITKSKYNHSRRNKPFLQKQDRVY